MTKELSRTALITAIDQAMKYFVDIGICIDSGEAWSWFCKFTGKKSYASCQDSQLADTLEQMRRLYSTHPASHAQIESINHALARLVDLGLYRSLSEATGDFIESWNAEPEKLAHAQAVKAMDSLSSIIRLVEADEENRK